MKDDQCSFCHERLFGAEKMDSWCASCPNLICYRDECDAAHELVCKKERDKSEEV